MEPEKLTMDRIAYKGRTKAAVIVICMMTTQTLIRSFRAMVAADRYCQKVGRVSNCDHRTRHVGGYGTERVINFHKVK